MNRILLILNTEKMHLLKQLKQKIRNNFIEDKSRSTIAFLIVSKYLPERYFPITGGSIGLNSLCSILNDISIHNRSSYLELGAGLSTLVLAKYAKLNKPEMTIHSVEHNLKWINFLMNLAKAEKLEKIINFIHAPLCKCEYSIDGSLWYDVSVIKQSLGNLSTESLLIDGPLAHRKEIEMSRYPALPVLHNHLDQNSIIFLDDACRKGEHKVRKKWAALYGLEFKPINKNTYFAAKGKLPYNFVP